MKLCCILETGSGLSRSEDAEVLILDANSVKLSAMNGSRGRERGRKRRIVLRRVNDKFLLEDDPELVEDLLRRGYGTRSERGLLLDPIEAAHLAAQRNKIVVDGVEVTETDLLKHVHNFLRYIVYRDLRKRGYFVKPAGSDAPLDLLVWEKGRKVGSDPPRYGIKIVTEGIGIKIADLAATLKYCESMGLQLVLALVSNDGVVTYYKVFSIRPDHELSIK